MGVFHLVMCGLHILHVVMELHVIARVLEGVVHLLNEVGARGSLTVLLLVRKL